MSDRQIREGNPAPDDERANDKEQPSDYYYDDSTGYEIYEDSEEDDDETISPPGS